MRKEIPNEIKEWAFWLSSGVLGEDSLPLCPWAKKSILEGSVCFWEEMDPLDLVPLSPEIKVGLVHLPGKSHKELIEIRNFCNSKAKEFIFLESHPKDDHLIWGLRTVSSLPLILIQRREELEKARSYLRRGQYYSYWDSKVLEEILNI